MENAEDTLSPNGDRSPCQRPTVGQVLQPLHGSLASPPSLTATHGAPASPLSLAAALDVSASRLSLAAVCCDPASPSSRAAAHARPARANCFNFIASFGEITYSSRSIERRISSISTNEDKRRLSFTVRSRSKERLSSWSCAMRFRQAASSPARNGLSRALARLPYAVTGSKQAQISDQKRASCVLSSMNAISLVFFSDVIPRSICATSCASFSKSVVYRNIYSKM